MNGRTSKAGQGRAGVNESPIRDFGWLRCGGRRRSVVSLSSLDACTCSRDKLAISCCSTCSEDWTWPAPREGRGEGRQEGLVLIDLTNKKRKKKKVALYDVTCSIDQRHLATPKVEREPFPLPFLIHLHDYDSNSSTAVYTVTLFIHKEGYRVWGIR